MSLSTNGVLLARYARELADAGLDDVNVSLDSLSPARFRQITGGGNLRDVLRGIDRAREVGLPVKINAVVMRGTNDADILSLAVWAYREQLPLRFIEFMPLDSRGLWSPDKVFTERDLIALLSREFEITPMARTSEPASYYLSERLFPPRRHFDRLQPVLRDRATASGSPRMGDYSLACSLPPASISKKHCAPGSMTDLLESRIRAAIFNKPRGFVERIRVDERTCRYARARRCSRNVSAQYGPADGMRD